MKKIITTLLCLLLIFTYSNAQQNLFDAADVDADGWIWFNTQAKIDKYIGQANNEEAKYDEKGKIIQMISAGFGDYVDSEASPEFVGAGTDGVLGGTGALTGAIKLAPASATSSTNGGGFIVKMPSCTSFNICVSADSKMYVRLAGTPQSGIIISDYQIASAKYATVFKALSSAGIYKWLDMEQLSTGNEPVFKLVSSSKMYAFFHNLTKNNLYIHGIKVMTEKPTGINDVENDGARVVFDGENILLTDKAKICLFNTQGALVRENDNVSMSVSGLNKGVYMAQVTFSDSKTVTKKIVIR